MCVMSMPSTLVKHSTRAAAAKVRATAVARRPSIATLSDDQARTLGKAAGRQAFDAALNAGLAVPMLSAGELTTKTKTAG